MALLLAFCFIFFLCGLIPVPPLLCGLIPVPPLLCGLIPVPPLLCGLIPKTQSGGGLGTRIGSPVCELQAALSWVGPGNEANSCVLFFHADYTTEE